MEPTFFVIGAPKCGTTTMYELLASHPEIAMCERKEPRFFSHDSVYARGWDWYLSLFPDRAGARAAGECSTCYGVPAKFPLAADRMATHVPNARLIYMVRHPLKRIESQWMMQQHHSEFGSATFEESLSAATLIPTSRYWEVLNRYRQYFADEQMLIVFFEDFVRDPRGELARCFAHIGVDPRFETDVDTEEARCAAKDRTTDRTRWLARLRNTDLFDRARDGAPRWLRRGLRSLLTRPQVYTPEWSDASREFALSQLRGDARALLAYCGKPADYWDLGQDIQVMTPQEVA